MWLPVLRAELGVLRGYGLAKDARHANDEEMLIQLADDPASRPKDRWPSARRSSWVMSEAQLTGQGRGHRSDPARRGRRPVAARPGPHDRWLGAAL